MKVSVDRACLDGVSRRGAVLEGCFTGSEEGCHSCSGRVRNEIKATSDCFTSEVGSRREAEKDVWAD